SDSRTLAIRAKLAIRAGWAGNGTLIESPSVPAEMPGGRTRGAGREPEGSTPGEGGVVGGVAFITTEEGAFERSCGALAGGVERPLPVAEVVSAAASCPAPVALGETTCVTVDTTGAVTWSIPCEATLLTMAVVPSTPWRTPAAVEVVTVPTGIATSPIVCMAVWSTGAAALARVRSVLLTAGAAASRRGAAVLRTGAAVLRTGGATLPMLFPAASTIGAGVTLTVLAAVSSVGATVLGTVCAVAPGAGVAAAPVLCVTAPDAGAVTAWTSLEPTPVTGVVLCSTVCATAFVTGATGGWTAELADCAAPPPAVGVASIGRTEPVLA